MFISLTSLFVLVLIGALIIESNIKLRASRVEVRIKKK